MAAEDPGDPRVVAIGFPVRHAVTTVSPESRKTSTPSSGNAKKLTAYWDVT